MEYTATSTPANSVGHLPEFDSVGHLPEFDPVRRREFPEASSSETLGSHFASTATPVGHASDDAEKAPPAASPKKQFAQWGMTDHLIRNAQREEAAGFKRRELGVTWNNLTVEVKAAEAAVKENMLSQFNLPQLYRDYRTKPPMKQILSNSHGCVKPGEMLLVLGRPGSGCTTLLKLLSNRREGYANISGDIKFGNMDHKEAVRYKGQIVMNTEEELFYPRLTVGQTMDFATKLKIPFHLPDGVSSVDEYTEETKDFLLKSMGIAHTVDTKVGNEFVRGVSGGERKRVSIIECLATRASLFTWDNSTRGLDASTALEWAKALRAMTDVMGLTTIVTLYQAGNGIYNLFDKVLVLDEGKQIYYGPAQEAKGFMEDLGFVYTEGANVGKYKSAFCFFVFLFFRPFSFFMPSFFFKPLANTHSPPGDFLTGVTVPTERQIRPGWENRFPRTADAILAEYNNSTTYKDEITRYDYPNTQQAAERTEAFKDSVAWEKSNHLPGNSDLTTSFTKQLRYCTARQYQILWGEKSTFIIRQVLSMVMALIAGSCFYDAPDTTEGLFTKGGAVFFSLMYNSLAAMSEVIESFRGRPILTKHKSFAMHHPAAFCLAQITADFPVLLFQCTIFSVVIYWMVGLKHTAAAFFTFWATLFITTLVRLLLGSCLDVSFCCRSSSNITHPH